MKPNKETTTVLAALSYLIEKQELSPQEIQQLIITTIQETE